MQVLADDAIWVIADTAKEAVQAWIQHFARAAAGVTVDVVANFTSEDLTEEERALLMRNAIELAAERGSELVGDPAEDLADKYL